ncbi:MAG: putative lipoprotein [Phenylobacterium sp.]|nr:putative lipoprotein [Phenylobacterium sp.]
MSRVPMFSALAVAAGLAACTPTLGPPPPGGFGAPAASSFRAEDFAWSAETGRGAIAGHLAYHEGKNHFTCTKGTVILTPETPWTRRRMEVLYLSSEAAALPADEVRARTPSAPSGDYSAFVRKATCDAASRFSFSGLPDGAWYAIAVAKPVEGSGPGIAVMRRVTTHGGRVTPLAL